MSKAFNMGRISKVFLFIVFLSASFQSLATHIRALEITARRISASTLTFEFTITGYRDVQGVEFANGEFRFGDGSEPVTEIPWIVIGNVGNDTEKWQFTLTHTFAGPGAYKVSYKEPFRNGGILNMSNSIGTEYFTETLILIDPLIGINSTPILTVPPIDLGASGLIFIHNPGAFDEDGDSLSYRLSIPLQANGVNVSGYLSPVDPSFYPDGFATGNQNQDGPPTLTLDPGVGDLIWDAPGRAGEYNVSFIVEEWREINGEYFRLGYVTRDMQIIIEETDNQAPELTPPDDLCVAAGTSIDDTVYEPDIIGTDPDNHPVTLSAFGGPFEIPGAASYSPDPPVAQGPPGILEFFWDTDCSHIRERPYEVRFKVEDNPPLANGSPTAPKLVDFETWNITVVGPAPTGLTVTPLPGRRVQLDWDSYSCPNTGASMQVWRRVGEFDFTPEDCEIGIPPGYELVATLPIDSDVYIDNNDGVGLAAGANYCYRLVATFPEPLGGTSYASNESCSEIVSNAALITKADIISTSTTTGETRVEWIDPPDIDGVAFPGPYTYELLRATGSTRNKTSFESIATDLTDQFYDDSGLNTDANAYSYMVVLIDNTLTVVDTSFAASTVRLDLQSRVGAINVTWDALVPWSIQDQDFPIHEIYRDQVDTGNPNDLVLIATVNAAQNGLAFLDDGSHNGVPLVEEIEYCYYVRTQGSYDNDDPTIPEPLINNSQIQCAQPNDEEAPCPPINVSFDPSVSCENLVGADSDCDFDDFLNRFSWEQDLSGECGDDVESYNIYFSETGVEGSYQLLVNTIDTEYTHLGLNSFNGCYRITAVDRSGNESEPSETICNENCIKDQNGKLRYQLPNVFTPNGDGVNDTFRALGDNNSDACPRFVLSVDFLVIDRTGKELYSYSTGQTEVEDDLYINWDGRNNVGKRLAAGTYFYSVVVRFDTLDPKDAVQNLNGWVQILR